MNFDWLIKFVNDASFESCTEATKRKKRIATVLLGKSGRSIRRNLQTGQGEIED